MAGMSVSEFVRQASLWLSKQLRSRRPVAELSDRDPPFGPPGG